jgi:hypothetical protein
MANLQLGLPEKGGGSMLEKLKKQYLKSDHRST